MKISVIIPTYKPKDYLWDCLSSLVKQTFPKEDFEVVLVLNGCSEPWLANITNYISCNMHGMNINFIHTLQGGVSNARNIAIDAVKGEYITFIDDDDFVSPTFLEELYSKARPDTISLCYAYEFNDGNLSIQLKSRITSEFETRYPYGRQHYTSTRKIFSGPCMKLIHRGIISKHRYDVRFKNGEDSLYMFLISKHVKYVEYTSSNAIYYRRFRENSAVTTSRSRRSIISNGLNLIKCYSRIYWSEPFKYSFIFYTTRILGTIRAMLG